MIPDAHEILPRLWVGPASSCDAAPNGTRCVCVLEGPHSPRCLHMPILGSDGKADPVLLGKVALTIDTLWQPNRPTLLVHCGAGVERSPLAVAWWLVYRFSYTFDEAYAWIKRQRPVAEDRRSWIR